MQIIIRGRPDVSSQLREAGTESTHPSLFGHVQPHDEVPSSYSLKVASGHINNIVDAFGWCQPLTMKKSKSRNKACIGVPGKSGGVRQSDSFCESGVYPGMMNRDGLSHLPAGVSPHFSPCHPKGNAPATTKNGAHTASHSILSFLGEKFLYCSCLRCRLSSSTASF